VSRPGRQPVRPDRWDDLRKRGKPCPRIPGPLGGGSGLRPL